MTVGTWLAFCATEALLCLTPGPAVLLVVSFALARGRRAGVSAASGVLAANAFYFAISATGVAALLLASRDLFVALRWAGAAYLCGLGLRMLLSRSAPGAEAPPVRAQRAFLRGVVVQGANPKALVFFAALLPQFVDPAAPVPMQIFVLGASSVAIELCVLALYAVAAGRARQWAGARVSGPLERLGGAFLVAAGARLAALRSH